MINRDIAVAVEDAIHENPAAMDMVRALHQARTRFEADTRYRDVLVEVMQGQPLRGAELVERLAGFVKHAGHMAADRAEERAELAAATAAERAVVERLDAAASARRDALKHAARAVRNVLDARKKSATGAIRLDPGFLADLDRAGISGADLELLRRVKLGDERRAATRPDWGSDDDLRGIVSGLISQGWAIDSYLKSRNRDRSLLPAGAEEILAPVADELTADRDRSHPFGAFRKQITAWSDEIISRLDRRQEGEAQQQVRAA